ncbi:MAG: DUF3071 domain-containing protein, partial [Frankiales bacterium]
MRELHVVATSEDGRHVVLATSRGASKGDFRVAIDDRLTAAVRGDLPRPGETEPVVVTPKEIQARLRAGETQEEIAASAGVPLTKIERYAGPVLSEIERVLDQARAGFVSRSRLGESALPLGEAVDRHLADTVGVRLETVAWSARREEVGTWLVELTYVSQARRRTATWRYDVAHREVTPTDANSAALAHVEPGNRRSRVADTDLVAAAPARRPAPRAATPVRARKAPAKAKAPKARAPKVTTVRAAPAPVRSVSARPPVRAAAPVPHAAAPARAAQTAVDKAALAREARAEAARIAAQEKAAKAAAAEAARQAAAADAAAAEQAREAERQAAAEAARKAKAAAAKKAKAEAARQAAAEKAAVEKAAAEKAAA